MLNNGLFRGELCFTESANVLVLVLAVGTIFVGPAEGFQDGSTFGRHGWGWHCGRRVFADHLPLNLDFWSKGCQRVAAQGPDQVLGVVVMTTAILSFSVHVRICKVGVASALFEFGLEF